MRGRRVQPAMTLMELLLTISLISLLAFFLWPDFSGTQRSAQLEESARRMKALVAMCRAEAMNNACTYRVIIRQDGTLRVRRQADPIRAPEEFRPVRSDWGQRAFLLDDVWVESVVPLPEGPPPIILEDDELTAYEDRGYDFDPELEPIAVGELELPLVIEFRPDGTSDSLRWILRDALGRGVQLTLDGRLGRVATELVDALDPEYVERPDPVEEDELDVLEEERLAEDLTGQERPVGDLRSGGGAP